MKIKTEKQQIREKLDSLITLRKENERYKERAYKRWRRKENWVYLSFILTPKDVLIERYKHFKRIEQELLEYEEILSQMLIDCKER